MANRKGLKRSKKLSGSKTLRKMPTLAGRHVR